MARPGPILILCILLGTLSSIYGSISLLNAQCRVKCLTEFDIPSGNISRTSCLASSNCTSCVAPCSTEYKSQTQCRRLCQSAPSVANCYVSCEFLKMQVNSKKGDCPALEDITGFGLACAETCSSDSQCGHKLKCCYNGCGRTCQEPIINKKFFPSKIRNPATVIENPDGESVTIEWMMRKALAAEDTVMFAIQGRNNTGHHPSKHHMSDWVDMAIVDEMHYVAYIGLGRYYSFRVAAVNVNGSLGFGQPTSPFRLSTDPSAPSSPINFREGRATVVGDRINVMILWDPPKNSDMELLRYRIFYSERRASVSPFLYGIEEHKHNVPKDRHHYELMGLHQGMRYFVQVQAIVQWGDERLRSERASMYIDTMEIHPQDSPPVPSPWDSAYQAPDDPTPSPPRDVVPEDAYWGEDGLKAQIRWRKPKGEEDSVDRFTIHWRPDSCLQDQQNTILEASTHGWDYRILPPYETKGATADDTLFDIYNLRFDCQYMVSIVAVSNTRKTSPAATIHFYTPPCTEVAVKGREKPICPTPVPDLPSPPKNVSYYFIISERNITAQFRWLPPSSSLHPITGYNIIWAEPRPEPPNLHGDQGFPILDMDTRHSKRLRHNELNYELSPLKSGTRYVVQLWATSSIGGGAMYTEDIKTPKVQTNPVMPDLNPPNWTRPPLRPDDNRAGASDDTETLSPAPNRTGKKGHQQGGTDNEPSEEGGNCACHSHLPMFSLLTAAALITFTVISLCR